MTMHRFFGFGLVALVASSGCVSKITLPVLKPAAVTIPAEIQTIAVIDRSSPKDAGQTVLGVLEGILTGEDILADNEGRTGAVSGAVTALGNSPRFTVVQPSVNPREVNSSVFDDVWSHRGVAKLCKKHKCDAVLALEVFDSDSVINNGAYLPSDDKYVEGVTTHWASKTTEVLTSWRLYDARADRHVDQWRGSQNAGSSRTTDTSIRAAMGKLPQGMGNLSSVGRSSGKAYVKRISPTWIRVSRKYYSVGSDEMKAATRHLRVNDWDGAADIWTEVIGDPVSDYKMKGKAKFNLALRAEVAGELQKALGLAQEAAVDLGSGRAFEYVRILKGRIRDQERLEAQMAGPNNDPDAIKVPGSSDDASSGAMTRPRSAGDTNATGTTATTTDDDGKTAETDEHDAAEPSSNAMTRPTRK